MSLGSMLARKAVTASPTDSLTQVARLMKHENVGAVIVTQDETPVGIVTDRDLAIAVCMNGVSPDGHVQDVMTCPVSTICDEEGVYTATQKLMEQGVRRLPVVDVAGCIVGLVSLDDLLLLLTAELQNLAEGIRAEVAS